MSRQNAFSMSLSHGEGSRSGAPKISRDIPAAAASAVCVLLTGRKEAAEALAYRIHSLSAWRHGPFTVVDCTWAESRVEAALYGTLAGRSPATEATQDERAGGGGGTVLLQEVGKLSTVFQAELAQRLADIRGDLSFGVPRRRLMASTSEPLLGRVIDGSFNHHLFYRLNVIHVIVSDHYQIRE